MRQTINSRFELAQYCLRSLGAPVIKINVTEQQIDDRIDDALDLFLQFHMDGSYRQVYVHRITQNDIDAKKIFLPDGIMSVLNVFLATDSSTLSSNMLNDVQVQAYFSDLISNQYNRGDIASYAMSQAYFSTFKSTLPNSGTTRYTSFRIYEGFLDVPDFRWNKMRVDQIVGIECYKFTDPDSYGRVYNDYWLKQYVTALIKKQWGQNLSKFSSITLPGGGTLNGEALYQAALIEIQDLEIKLKDQYSLPISPFMR